VLVDAGISARRIRQHLNELGLDLEDLDGICITHEHGDHIKALPQLGRKYGIPVYANADTASYIAGKPKYDGLTWKIFTTGHDFSIGPIQFHPFTIPHDAMDPVGYVVEHEGFRIGFATDIGLATRLVKGHLTGCHVLLLETNHDRLLLEDAQRPWSTKQRIAGRQGHLSNEEACDLLRAVIGPELQQIYLGHISQDCNQPELAESTVRMTLKELSREDVKITLTYADRPASSWSAT
jgi:phosphoribosyl 1,2-cyclic phosphodiesterase